MNYNKKYKCISICALASSGRLCYLYFKPQGAVFEVELFNDLSKSRPTKMDAVIGDDNFECKCQEIVDKSHTPLSEKYLQSALFKEMGVKHYKVETIKVKDKETGRVIYRNVLRFDVSELNIRLDAPRDYSNLHFDLKQLICHLIAIANNKEDGSPKTLKYVFFTPNTEAIAKYKKVGNLYRELEQEIKAILDEESAITTFAAKHNINIQIDESSFVQLRDVEDFVYSEAFKS